MRATADGLLGLMIRLKKALAPWEFWELCRKNHWDRLLGVIKAFIASIILVRPIADKDVPKRLQDRVVKARKFATSRGYSAIGYLWWLFQPGLWLRSHVPLWGKCVEAWAFMAGWTLKNDEATGSWLVCWIPLFLEESTSKSVDQQKDWMAEMRKNADLPDHYFSNFGSGVLVALLLLTYKRLTGKEIVPRGKFVRTDTLFSDGIRFRLRFVAEGLGGDFWGWCEVASSRVGCLLLGVEVLEPSDTGLYVPPPAVPAPAKS